MEYTTYTTVEELNDSSFRNLTDMEYFEIHTINTELNVVLLVISAVLFCIGVVGNTATIVIIRFRKDFHSTTFTAIGLLAFVDLVAVCLREILLVNHFYCLWHNWEFIFLTVNQFNGILVVTFITLVCSCIHVVILARLRYKLLAFPIQGLNITPKHLVYQSTVAWSISCILGIPYGLITFLLNRYDAWMCDIILSVVTCVCTVLPIVTFHILKVRKLQEGINPNTNTTRSMNKMVLAICFVQIISITSCAIGLIISFKTGFNAYLGWTFGLLLMTNHVMNPILFFYFTSCRRVFKLARNNRVHRNEQCESRMWRYCLVW